VVAASVTRLAAPDAARESTDGNRSPYSQYAAAPPTVRTTMQPIRERQPKGARVEGETGRYGHPIPSGSGRVA
jgi:hypothetical protein